MYVKHISLDQSVLTRQQKCLLVVQLQQNSYELNCISCFEYIYWFYNWFYLLWLYLFFIMEENSTPPGNMSNEKKIRIIKALIVIGCLVAFVLNSYFIFADYIEGNTVISTDLRSAENGTLASPSLLICGKNSFEKKQLNTNINEYWENSLKLDDFLTFTLLLEGNTLHKDIRYVTDRFQAFYTVFYGSCYMLDLNYMVR